MTNSEKIFFLDQYNYKQSLKALFFFLAIAFVLFASMHVFGLEKYENLSFDYWGIGSNLLFIATLPIILSKENTAIIFGWIRSFKLTSNYIFWIKNLTLLLVAGYLNLHLANWLGLKTSFSHYGRIPFELGYKYSIPDILSCVSGGLFNSIFYWVLIYCGFQNSFGKIVGTVGTALIFLSFHVYDSGQLNWGNTFSLVFMFSYFYFLRRYFKNFWDFLLTGILFWVGKELM